MAAEPPSPRPRSPRFAEDPQVVHSRVPAAVPVEARGETLGVVKDVLQAHGQGNRDVPGGGQPRGDKAHGGALLSGPLLVQGKAAVIGGGVEPPASFGVRIGVHRD